MMVVRERRKAGQLVHQHTKAVVPVVMMLHRPSLMMMMVMVMMMMMLLLLLLLERTLLRRMCAAQYLLLLLMVMVLLVCRCQLLMVCGRLLKQRDRLIVGARWSGRAQQRLIEVEEGLVLEALHRTEVVHVQELHLVLIHRARMLLLLMMMMVVVLMLLKLLLLCMVM